ncbi:putative Ctr copper transporter [Chloropicon primus]|uniref:Copper transport protein n=1 Tax=Chloropicon primus TaxID=1764295 RepID=A0A5B8MTT2_9CHLO|nr:hypothetical protein A3770_09p53680 [Chloropicon primus]UPR02074.1 putative Ctr copper transporter [Chloropicon primus]|eukprot:QDZ22850.1 hypothetical protein A3770_09p53680 [Chloropicon primus]
MNKNMTMAMMPMYFTNSYKTTLWFKEWRSESRMDYYFMLFVVTVLGFALEALQSVRRDLDNKRGHHYEELLDVQAENREHYMKLVRAASAFLYFLSLLLGYLLMLAAMTFNVGLFLSVIVGMTLGFYFLRTKEGGTTGAAQGVVEGNHCGLS